MVPVDQTGWVRLITLKYPGTCVVCGTRMLVGSTGWHDSTTKKITCTSCGPADTTPAMDLAAATEPLLPQPPVTDPGTPGADGEVALGRLLDDELDGHAVVLHDRQRPGTTANIDHIVIAPTGVWVIDAKNWQGDVERRNIGGWFHNDYRLYVNRRDRTQTTRLLDQQTAAVTDAFAPLGLDSVPVHPCMCFVDAMWPPSGSHQFEINGVFISSPAELVLKILEPGTLTADTIQMIAAELSAKLPPAA
jgi:hypothetical protein